MDLSYFSTRFDKSEKSLSEEIGLFKDNKSPCLTFLDDDQLFSLGKDIADGNKSDPQGLINFNFYWRNKENGKKIFEAYRLMNSVAAQGESIIPAAQWLLDNYYLVQENLFYIRQNLSSHLIRSLPRIKVGKQQGFPCALVLAWFYVTHSDGMISTNGLKAIINGFQSVHGLKIQELWVLPSLLRLVLIEMLRRLVIRVVKIRQMALQANNLADRILRKEYPEGDDYLAEWTLHAKDHAFATQLLHRLRDGSESTRKALEWLEKKLEKDGSDAEEITLMHHRNLSAHNVTSGNIITSLRLIENFDWRKWFEEVSQVDRFLSERTDFSRLDPASRDQYRVAVEELARNSNFTEYEIAERSVSYALETAKGLADLNNKDNIGFLLVGHRREEFEHALRSFPSWRIRIQRFFQRTGWLCVFVPVFTMASFLLVGTGLVLHGAGLALSYIGVLLASFLLPAMQSLSGLYHFMVFRLLPPKIPIGYDYAKAIPETARTMVALPVLISSRDDVDDAIRNLETHYWANRKENIFFALLSDWGDSHVEVSKHDLDILKSLREEIKKLNTRYPASFPLFYLLHRRRLFNPSEGCWMGWERKRGKLHELNLLLRGEKNTNFFLPDEPLPQNIIYVMTVDLDAKMTYDCVACLVGKLDHPVNYPVVDHSTKLVVSGFSIIQPRIVSSLSSASGVSFFQRVFCQSRGLDPYIFGVSDFYQDLFEEATFTGKGLYRIKSMEDCLKGKIPENSVLSHDLLEGAFARTASTSDVQILESYPTRYLVDCTRQHRWTRGDWQLLPFLFKKDPALSSLSRWKIIDNLIRSLTPIFYLSALLAGFILCPFYVAIKWFSILIFSQNAVFFLEAGLSLFSKGADITLESRLSLAAKKIALWGIITSLNTLFVAHKAWMIGDAIIRTLYRLYFSFRRLLEWRTAAQAEKLCKGSVSDFFLSMHGAIIIGCSGLLFSAASQSGWESPAIGFLLSLSWIGSPMIAYLISRSDKGQMPAISWADRKKLRIFARRTWVYFEKHVTQEHNFLPPDNMQEKPEPLVAARTSPTNIGLYLLSVISARDFGWISLSEAVSRIESTLSTLQRMEQYRGHFYNWYETKTLNLMHPAYVSTVDSGNLASHLIAMRGACLEWAEFTSAYLEGDVKGILDTVEVLEEILNSIPDDKSRIEPLHQRIVNCIQGVRKYVSAIEKEPELAATHIANIVTHAKLIRKLGGVFHNEIGTPKSELFLEWGERLESVTLAHNHDSRTDREHADKIRMRLEKISGKIQKIIMDMDFSFLFNKELKLFSIGFRTDQCQQDQGCYDLLASEARITSMLAIAKGDVPHEHWFKLGRPIVETQSGCALLSWSGSMFEYLMPSLVVKEPRGGILDQTNHNIIRQQIVWAKKKKIPWGISEATYNARDNEMNYQYMNFGVPGLGLKRGLEDNTVVAPYACMLASQFVPHESLKNLEVLSKMGALGQYGFYDAVDFTPQRVPEGENHAVVFNFYAHHQGMSIVAICNALLKGRMRNRFHSAPMIAAAETLLEEKIPDFIPNIRGQNYKQTPIKVQSNQIMGQGIRLVDDPLTKKPMINLMSNGSWSTMVLATGSGCTKWKDLSVTRWWPDAAEERYGTFIFLRDVASGLWWSASAAPKCLQEETLKTIFKDNKSTFIKTAENLRSELECIVASEVDGEARRITLYNESDSDRYIEVTSYAELALAAESQDSAHPAFSKMFIETKISAEQGVIYAHRRSRSGETRIALAHFATDSYGYINNMEAETDRRVFIGRGRSIRNPVVLETEKSFEGRDGFVLDPIVALRRKIRVPAKGMASLTFWTIVGNDEEEVKRSVSYMGHPENFYRQKALSWTHSQVQIRHCGLTLEEAATAQKIAGNLIYSNPFLKMPKEKIVSGFGKQSELWPMGVSGDFPVFILRIADINDIEIIAQALRFQEYLRNRRFLSDLVIINEQDSSYAQDLQRTIEWHCENSSLRGRESGPRQHIFALRKDLMSKASWEALLATAGIVLHTQNGRITDQIARAEIAMERTITRPTKKHSFFSGERKHFFSKKSFLESSSLQSSQKDRNDILAYEKSLAFWNGTGGFSKNGREYIICLRGGSHTPAPWINVITNENFGFHTSAEGASFTWSENSRDFQITPWSNDPVSNRPGEAIYIYEKVTGKAFSPFSAVVPDPEINYETHHGQGYSVFKIVSRDLQVEATQIVDPRDPVKITRLKLINTGETPLDLRVYSYIEWVLGNKRSRAGATIFSFFDPDSGSLLAQNPFNIDYADRVAFSACSHKPQSFTTDRQEFFGPGGCVENPQSVLAGADLSGKINIAEDSCAASVHDIKLDSYQTIEMIFLLGVSSSIDKAKDLIRQNFQTNFKEKEEKNKIFWNSFLEKIQVQTPDNSFNFMINAWLPYQVLSCRLWARSGFYQASGAFGFRDQLQDVLALMWQDPSLARQQILEAAKRQFLEGDVQHWWLPSTGAGVRTLISDDIVWLGYAVSEYINATGDKAVLEEKIPFLEGAQLQENQKDLFFMPTASNQEASLYEHCALGLDLAVHRTGTNELPLILSGDWNDGMNEVGIQGKGESVWLGWFLLGVLRKFIPLAQERKDISRLGVWKNHALKLEKSLENNAWGGEWYLRAILDDGNPLGSKESPECIIDSIAQSWSVLSGQGNTKRSIIAMNAVKKYLFDDKLKTIKLFTPPFSGTKLNPGYIASYPPGVRENGGQYTHAAAWVVAALARLGEAEEAFRCFSWLNPINHSHDVGSAQLYRVEPYVVSGDVYSCTGLAGQGGWSWYTGGAAWLYRAGVEFILGIGMKNGCFYIKPVIPDSWPGFDATLKSGSRTLKLSVKRSKEVISDRKIKVNKKEVDPDEGVFLSSESITHIEVLIPLASSLRATKKS